jgi:hypothetical protein
MVMSSLFVYIGSRLKQMPIGLHLLIILALFAPIFALGLHFHFTDFAYSSQFHVGLPKVLLIAVGSAVFVYGLLQATWWLRPLFVLWLVGSSIWAIFQNHAAYSFLNYLGLLATDVFVVWILYLERGARNYFVSTHKPVA